MLVGCYERFLFGFEADTDAEVRNEIEAMMLGVAAGNRKNKTERERERARARTKKRKADEMHCCLLALTAAAAAAKKKKKKKSHTFFSLSLSASPAPQKKLQKHHQPAKLRRSFYVPVHRGPVKCVASAAPFAATGGVDDTIHLFDVARHVDLGFLMSPGDGAVTSLAMYAPPDPNDPARATLPPSHLISGSADGGISVWTAGKEWECLKTMAEAHSGPVSSISVHPSGRVFLSVDLGSGGGGGSKSKGGSLRLWNLVKGKSQFKTRLPAAADVVAFAPGACPENYALLCGDELSVRSLTASSGGDGDDDGDSPPSSSSSSGVVATFGGPASGVGRQQAACWLDASTLASGGDDGSLHLWDIRCGSKGGGKSVCRVARAHGARVKGVASMNRGGGGGGGGGNDLSPGVVVASCATDGTVRLWDLRASLSNSSSSSPSSSDPASSTTPLASAEASGARLTCLSVVAAVAPDRSGVKLTPQQKSRRAKREATAAAAAEAEAAKAAGLAPPGTPNSSEDASTSRPTVKVPNAKARRKALRKELLGKGGALDAKKQREREEAAEAAKLKKQKREEKEKEKEKEGGGGAVAAAEAAKETTSKKDKKKKNKNKNKSNNA